MQQQKDRAKSPAKPARIQVKPKIARRSLFYLLFPLICVVFSPAAGRSGMVDLLRVPEQLVPERDIALDADRAVAWKKAWDQARYLARTGDYLTAEKKYEELLALKGNVEQARWEYARLLLITGKWEKAAAVLERLVEKAPDRVDYLNSLALVSRKTGKLSRALDLFRKAYEKNPADLTGLAGLAQGLVEVGRKKEAFPLLEEIFSRRPDDSSIRRALASLAYELGRMEKAAKLMLPLAATEDADLDTLRMTARIYEELGDLKTAADYWSRCLKHDPGDREAHGRLALYYEKTGRSGQALPHLLALLEKDPDNATLLSRICRIYIRSDRFAEALPYFERYVTLRPDEPGEVMPVSGAGTAGDDSDIISLYRRLLAVTPDDLELLDALADDLLEAGDAGMALFMWEHAARLHPDRIEIYQEIVDLLEKLGRDERLAEILEIIHRLAPGEVRVVSKLANLKAVRGELLTALEYYNKLEKAGYAGEDLLQGRGRLNEDLGRLSRALADYRRLLDRQPDRLDIRRRCIILAGKLGENSFLREQVTLLEESPDPQLRERDLLLAADAFAAAHDFEEALARYQALISSRTGADSARMETGNSDFFQTEAELGLADLYLKEGLVIEAEQLLRVIFLRGERQGEVLGRLFDIALARNNPRISEAEVWLARYALLADDPGKVALMRARLLAAVQAHDQAERLLKELFGGGTASAGSGGRDGLPRRAGLLLAEINIEAGDPGRAEQLGLTMLEEGRDREVLVVVEKSRRLAGKDKAAAAIQEQLFAEADDSDDFLGLAELYRNHAMPAAQTAAAERAFKQAPASLAAAHLLAEGRAALGQHREAVELLAGMAEKYPRSLSLIARMARYYFLNGQYASALQYCDRFLEENPARLDVHFLKMRCLAALGDDRSAEKALERLFPVGTEELLKKEAAAAGIELAPPPARKTFLEMLGFSGPKPPSFAGDLMSAGHLVDNSAREKKALNYIAVQLYARYRWEKRFLLAAGGG